MPYEILVAWELVAHVQMQRMAIVRLKRQTLNLLRPLTQASIIARNSYQGVRQRYAVNVHRGYCRPLKEGAKRDAPNAVERRSTREYMEQSIEKERIETLLKGAMAVPSAGNQ